MRAGRGATLMPSDLWLTEPNKGFLGVQLRAWAQGVLYVAQDFKHSDDAVADGNPKNRTPRRGLIIDGSANDTTVISAPRGLSTSTVAPARARQRRRPIPTAGCTGSSCATRST